MVCVKCDDTGIRLVPGDDGGWVQQFCDCAKGLAARYHGIPPYALTWTFESFPGSVQAVNAIRNWFGDGSPSRWLLLSGPVGVGKTGLAVCTFKAFRDLGKEAIFWPIHALLDVTKDSFDNVGARNPIVELSRDDKTILFIDDIGAERGTEWATTEIAKLIQARHALAATTVLTTNLSLQQIGEVYGARVADRLSEMALIIVLRGKSLRRASGIISVLV